MITQNFTQGEHAIKIESAESIEEAKLKGFQEGIYSRYFVDGKAVENYMAMMRFIIEEIGKNRKNLVPADKDLIAVRDKMLADNGNKLKNEVEKVKEMYAENGVSGAVISALDDFIAKIDPVGVRVKS